MNIRERFSSSYVFLCAVALCFSLTSCFDVKEEITINKNGSGKYSQTFNMGNNPMMRMAMAMSANDSTGEDKVAESQRKMDSTMQVAKENLSKVKGISNVQTSGSAEDLRFTVSYDFADIDALNNAINADDEKRKTFYSYKKGTLTRSNSLKMDTGSADDSFSKMIDNIDNEDDSEDSTNESTQAKQMVKAMFADSNYELVVHVPNKIKSYSNKSNTTISEDEKTLKTIIPLTELLDKSKKTSIGTTIKFK